MDRTKDQRPYLCAQMPEAAEILTSERFLPEIAEDMRHKIKDSLLAIEGSPQDGGMTCIAVKDFPVIAEKMKEGIEFGQLTKGYSFRYRDHLRGFLRNLNRHCEECSTLCRDRVSLTRHQLAALSRSSYTNSRRAKMNPPASEELTA